MDTRRDSGLVVYEGEDGLEHRVPHGEYTLTKSDGCYTLTGPAREYLIVAPEPLGAEGYLDQQLENRTLQIIEGVRP